MLLLCNFNNIQIYFIALRRRRKKWKQNVLIAFAHKNRLVIFRSGGEGRSVLEIERTWNAKNNMMAVLLFLETIHTNGIRQALARDENGINGIWNMI